MNRKGAPTSFTCPKSTMTSFGPGATIRFPGCGSAWKQPVLDQHLAERHEKNLRHLGRIDARALQSSSVRNLDPLDELHHQHAPRRVFPVDLRDDDVLDAREVGRDLLRVVSLADEVQLARDHPAHFFRNEAQVQRLVQPVQDADERRVVLQIVLHQALDAWILHLHGHHAPVVQHRPVHLRQRRRRHRRALELPKHGLERLPQLPLD